MPHIAVYFKADGFDDLWNHTPGVFLELPGSLHRSFLLLCEIPRLTSCSPYKFPENTIFWYLFAA